MATVEPSFQVLDQAGPFQLRKYDRCVVAETTVATDFERAGNAAFGRLVRYIGGHNAAQARIAMTAPVTQSADSSSSEKIPMTAPVIQESDGEAYRVAFILPDKYTLATAPRPLDPAIGLREIPARLLACWRYTGRWTRGNYQRNEQRLRREIESRSLVVSGDAILARYNPPFLPWFLRRNEVMIPVRRSARP